MGAPNIGKTNKKLRGKCHAINDVFLGLEINVALSTVLVLTLDSLTVITRMCLSPFVKVALLTVFFEILNCAIVSIKHNIII